MRPAKDIDSAQTQAQFADLLWEIGEPLHANHYLNKDMVAEHRTWLMAKIEDLRGWLRRTEPGDPIHQMSLLVLCHAYFSVFRCDWNYDDPESYRPLRQAIETVNLLEVATRRRRNAHLTDHLCFLRYFMCGRYSCLKAYSYKFKKLDLSQYDALMIADKQYLSHVEAPIVFADKTLDEIILRNRIKARLFFPDRHIGRMATPMKDWWADGVEDRYIQLLRSARIRTDGGSQLLWQWHLTDALSQFLSPQNEQTLRPTINRLARLGSNGFGGKVPKSGISDKNVKLYWASTRYSLEYRGYRVFAAALATRRNWLDQIITHKDLSRAQKQELLVAIEPFCGLSRGAVKACIRQCVEMNAPTEITDVLRIDLDKMPTIEQRRQQRQKSCQKA